jgi:hypothetical protein
LLFTLKIMRRERKIEQQEAKTWVSLVLGGMSGRLCLLLVPTTLPLTWHFSSVVFQTLLLIGLCLSGCRSPNKIHLEA